MHGKYIYEVGYYGLPFFESVEAFMTQLNLSVRAYHRILKISRTIADLAGSEEIQSTHLTEALHASQSSKDHNVMEHYDQ